jgi:CheY-like chemotaxis protein
MDTVLFIDDEAFFARRYIEELKTNFTVIFCESAIEAIELIRNGDEFRAVILDIQMPPPKDLSPQTTNGGLDTGLWLLREVKDLVIQRPLPVAILTNRLPNVIQGTVDKMGFPEQLIEIRHKTDTPADKLVIRLQIMIQRWPRV